MVRTGLVSLLVLAMGLGFALPRAAGDSLEQLQQERDDYTGEAGRLEHEQAAILSELFGLNRQLETARTNLQRLHEEVASAAAAAAVIEAELAALRQRYEQRQQLLGRRLRFMYVHGNTTYLEVLLAAADFKDFLTRMDLFSYVAQHDVRLMAELRRLTDHVRQQEIAAEQQGRQLAILVAEAETQDKQLADLVAQRAARLAAVQHRRAELTQALANLEQEWENAVWPVLWRFSQAFRTLSSRMDEFVPDSIRLRLPIGVSVVISDETLNNFVANLPEFADLKFRISPGRADILVATAGAVLEVEGTFTIASATVIRYIPQRVHFAGISIPAELIHELNQSGDLDIDLSPVLGVWQLQGVAIEAGRVIGTAGLGSP